MKSISWFTLLFWLLSQSLFSANPVPYSGKIDIQGVNYFGEAQFAFSLHDGNGTTHWRNGNQPGETLKVAIRNGRYNVLLGGQGMTSLAPQLFLNQDKLYLKVEVDTGDGKGLRHLAPDQLITATPRSLVADIAKVAELAKVSETVSNGAITRDMLSAEVRADLNSSGSSTPMTPQSGSIARSMLASDILADLNRTVTPQMIQSSSITTAQLNEQILKYLKPEITVSPQAPGLIFGGQSMNLTSQAQGKYLTYQWQRNGQPIAGATGPSFSISDVNGSLHDGNYSVVVSNDFGSVTSALTPLQVDGTPSAHTVASISMEMIFCPPGTFTMGSPTSESGRGGDETQHQVTLTNGFYLGRYEVTQGQYETVMTGNSEGLNAKPSNWPNNNDRPVDQASWNDVQVFLSRLNDLEQTAGRLPAGWRYVLPTEAQWEYACRAGMTTAYSWGNDINSSLANYSWDGGWNNGSDLQRTRDVGQYVANPWGFFDMHGNVWEWTADAWGRHASGVQTDPFSAGAWGSSRVIRGGSWKSGTLDLRSANRDYDIPSSRSLSIGFRVGFQSSK